MKIGCQCGASIIDQADDLPHKGHLIPDQAWCATCDAIDDEVIDAVADGRVGREKAYHHARQIISRAGLADEHGQHTAVASDIESQVLIRASG